MRLQRCLGIAALYFYDSSVHHVFYSGLGLHLNFDTTHLHQVLKCHSQPLTALLQDRLEPLKRTWIWTYFFYNFLKQAELIDRIKFGHNLLKTVLKVKFFLLECLIAMIVAFGNFENLAIILDILNFNFLVVLHLSHQ